jgi:hypothetical protein
MGHDDRDRNFEKALAQQLRLGVAGAAQNAACPDAETLAAYHERELSLEELSFWKTHIASCARCQEILAHLELTDNLPIGAGEEVLVNENVPGVRVPGQSSVPGVVRELQMAAAPAPAQAQAPPSPSQAAIAKVATIHSPRPHWRWTAPLGAVAAGLLVWIVLHENKSLNVQPPPPIEIAANHDQAASPLPAQSSAETPALKKVAPRNEPSQRQESDSRARANAITNPKPNLPPKDSKQTAAPVPPDLSAALPVATQPSTAGGALTESKRKSATNLPLFGRSTAGGRALAPSAPRPAASKAAGAATARGTAPSPPASGGSSSDAAASVSAAPAPPAPAAQKDADNPPQSVTETATVTGAASPVATGASVSDHQLQTVDRRSSAQFLVVMPGPPGTISISAPGGRISWRVGLQGAVERTDDAGKSWKPQKSGVTADLIAGSAPSGKICWLVGRQGTVLFTKDGGKHWRKVAPPAEAELASVRAMDDLTALVSDVAGRTYQTADGGKTWTLVNKQ